MRDKAVGRRAMLALPIVGLRLLLAEHARRKGVAKYYAVSSSEYANEDYWTVQSDDIHIHLTHSPKQSEYNNARVQEGILSSKIGMLIHSMRQIRKQLNSINMAGTEHQKANAEHVATHEKKLEDFEKEMDELVAQKEAATKILQDYKQTVLAFPLDLYDGA